MCGLVGERQCEQCDLQEVANAYKRNIFLNEKYCVFLYKTIAFLKKSGIVARLARYPSLDSSGMNVLNQQGLFPYKKKETT